MQNTDPDDPNDGADLAEVEFHLARAALCARNPEADTDLVEAYLILLRTAWFHHETTGEHLDVYDELGALFGAMAFGIERDRDAPAGAVGRMGDDNVQIVTIPPFDTGSVLRIALGKRFDKVLVVTIEPTFAVSGRLIDRGTLPPDASGSTILGRPAAGAADAR